MEGGEGKRWDLCEGKDTEEAVPRDFGVILWQLRRPRAARTRIKNQQQNNSLILKVGFLIQSRKVEVEEAWNPKNFAKINAIWAREM